MASPPLGRFSRSSLVQVLLLVFVITFAQPSSQAASSYFNRSRWLVDEPPEGDVPSVTLLNPHAQPQGKIDELLERIERGRTPRTPQQVRDLFTSLLKESGNWRPERNMRIGALTDYLVSNGSALSNTLSFLASIARDINLLFPRGLPYLTHDEPVRHLKRIQVFGLLAASFFGIIPFHQQGHRQGFGGLVDNYLDFFYMGFFDNEHKVKALFAYFTPMASALKTFWFQIRPMKGMRRCKCTDICRCDKGSLKWKNGMSRGEEVVSFYLHAPHRVSFRMLESRVDRPSVHIEEIVNSNKPLAPVKVDYDGDIMQCDGELQVAFANVHVGARAVAENTASQEEAMFLLRPELLSLLIFVPPLREQEALVVKGAESFSHNLGYESDYEYVRRSHSGRTAGAHWSFFERTPLDPLGRRDTTVAFIDSLDVSNYPHWQYETPQIYREIIKLSLGFQGDPYEMSLSKKLAPVATGMWGCAHKGGDNELKTLLQWIAASYAGRPLHYNCYSDEKLQHVQDNLRDLSKKYPTIRSLYDAIKRNVRDRGGPSGRGLWMKLLGW